MQTPTSSRSRLRTLAACGLTVGALTLGMATSATAAPAQTGPTTSEVTSTTEATTTTIVDESPQGAEVIDYYVDGCDVYFTVEGYDAGDYYLVIWDDGEDIDYLPFSIEADEIFDIVYELQADPNDDAPGIGASVESEDGEFISEGLDGIETEDCTFETSTTNPTVTTKPVTTTTAAAAKPAAGATPVKAKPKFTG